VQEGATLQALAAHKRVAEEIAQGGGLVHKSGRKEEKEVKLH